MKLLALETSTEACSVALALDGKVIERFEMEPRHGERLLPMVQELLSESGMALTQLNAIAFGRGPGSFTSLRIGAGVAQGLAFGADLPVVPISSLVALAQGVDAPKVLAAFDARMQQVYWCAFVRNSQGFVEAAGEERVLAPQTIPVPEGSGWIGAGTGWDAYHAVLQKHLAPCLTEWRPKVFPHARHVAELAARDFNLGKAVAPELALPVYIRDDVAKPVPR